MVTEALYQLKGSVHSSPKRVGKVEQSTDALAQIVCGGRRERRLVARPIERTKPHGKYRFQQESIAFLDWFLEPRCDAVVASYSRTACLRVVETPSVLCRQSVRTMVMCNLDMGFYTLCPMASRSDVAINTDVVSMYNGTRGEADIYKRPITEIFQEAREVVRCP